MVQSKKEPPSYFHGFYVSWEMDVMIRCYALMHNIPISQVLRSISQKWISEEGLTEEKVVDGLSHKLCLDWDIKKMDKSSTTTKEEFIKSWQCALETIPMGIVKKVIEKFKNETD